MRGNVIGKRLGSSIRGRYEKLSKSMILLVCYVNASAHLGRNVRVVFRIRRIARIGLHKLCGKITDAALALSKIPAAKRKFHLCVCEECDSSSFFFLFIHSCFYIYYS